MTAPITVDAAAVCSRCGNLAEVRAGKIAPPGGPVREEYLAHCLSRLCGTWFSLPDPDPDQNSQEIP